MKQAFADTSAWIGLWTGHPACLRLADTYDWVTSHIHALEAYAFLRRASQVPRDRADALLHGLLRVCVPVPEHAIEPAWRIRSRLRSKGEDCSYVDALGYGMARSLGLPLLI